MDLVIRQAARGDFGDVYPLFEQLWPGKSIDRVEIKKVFERGIDSEADTLFCALLDDRMIGFCAYAIMNCLAAEGQIAYVYALVVDEKYRGKGYGTKIIDEVIGCCRGRGLNRVELDSGFQREEAHHFYEKLGFRKRAYLFSFEL